MVLDVVHYYLRRRLSTAAPILRSRCHDVCVCVGMLAWQNENPRLKWLETWHRSSLRDSAVKPVDFGFKRSRVSVSFITLEESAPIYIFRDCAFLLVFFVLHWAGERSVFHHTITWWHRFTSPHVMQPTNHTVWTVFKVSTVWRRREIRFLLFAPTT